MRTPCTIAHLAVLSCARRTCYINLTLTAIFMAGSASWCATHSASAAHSGFCAIAESLRHWLLCLSKQTVESRGLKTVPQSNGYLQQSGKEDIWTEASQAEKEAA